jgi:hypothetical protein
MKDFKLTINWNRVYEGEFPTEELKSVDENVRVSIEKISVMEQKVTIETKIDDDADELQMAYTLGRFLYSYSFNRK